MDSWIFIYILLFVKCLKEISKCRLDLFVGMWKMWEKIILYFFILVIILKKEIKEICIVW